MATEHIGLHPSFAILPLLSQSLTVFYALIEPTIFIPFLRAAEADRAAAQRVTRLWWTQFLPLGLVTIVSISLPGIFAGIFAARQLPSNSLEWKLYAAGTAFSSGHFLAGPTMIKIMTRICDEEVEKRGETMEHVRQWLRVHLVRSLTTDLPALLCFGYLAFGI